jgi:hypothetical protein
MERRQGSGSRATVMWRSKLRGSPPPPLSRFSGGGCRAVTSEEESQAAALERGDSVGISDEATPTEEEEAPGGGRMSSHRAREGKVGIRYEWEPSYGGGGR